MNNIDNYTIEQIPDTEESLSIIKYVIFSAHIFITKWPIDCVQLIDTLKRATNCLCR